MLNESNQREVLEVSKELEKKRKEKFPMHFVQVEEVFFSSHFCFTIKKAPKF